MKSDTGSQPTDPIERAHLRDPRDRSHTMHRYLPASEFTELIGRYWFPVWSVPTGCEAEQRVLQYPVCLMVVTAEYSRFYGVASGVSSTTLVGDGWAAGVMLTPAAGHAIAGRSVDAFTDRHVDLEEVLAGAGAELTARVRALMAERPDAAVSHRAAIAAYEAVLAGFLPIDEEGELINEMVGYVESNPGVLRVGQICAHFDLPERTVQRLVRRRLGLTPKWLIQRRRLHEAALHLRESSAPAAELAFLLGYSDQAHFIRDFKNVTSLTPGQFTELNRG
ncbi:AraC family transcriptional regulator [Arthrobacter sp. H35-D1]|uniref:helix-turn-helix domain-containing protein n=1 Tax=Arthrobacter sp. H35-D1 TaxID=3046202 RepID=UPI0024BBEB13|nr:AraC family transcriptional regulator [Arthrobacter sp. H35-D1]MDJ0313160.1 AraC family transcriptional regulator [Arthrobacter sp. H35-D1]